MTGLRVVAARCRELVRTPRRLGVLLAVLAAVLLVVNGALFWSVHRDEQAAAAGQAARDTAQRQVVAMLSYGEGSVDKDLDAAVGGLTGPFRQQFADLAHQRVAPAAKQQHTSTHTSVSASSVIGATPSRVRLLMFLNQTTQSTGAAVPKLANSRVRVTLDDVDGRWLVSELTPL